MSCDIINGNWLDAYKSAIKCGINTFTVEQMRSANIGLKIERALCNCPNILNEESTSSCNVEGGTTLSFIYNKVKCGNVLSEIEIQWATSMILIKEIDCCENGY